MMLTPRERAEAEADVDLLTSATKEDSGRYVQIRPIPSRVEGGNRTTIMRNEYLTPDGGVGYEDVVFREKGRELWLLVRRHVGPESYRDTRIGQWLDVTEDS